MTENSEQVSAPEVSFVDLKTQLARLRPDIDARLAAVMSHGQFIMGPEVIEFENELANFAGAEIAVGVASGTDALRIALMAEGIGAGDAVFLPSFTFTATAEDYFAAARNPFSATLTIEILISMFVAYEARSMKRKRMAV